MPRQRPAAAAATVRSSELWPVVAVRVPPDWKRWLEESSQARGQSVAAVVRIAIRDLMLRRHEQPPGGGAQT